MNLIKLTYNFLFICIILGCSKDLNKSKIVEIEIYSKSNDSCYLFITKELDTLKFERKIKILENNISDTLIFGDGVLPPNRIGCFNYTKLKNRTDISLDLDYKNPPADRLCFHSYKNKNSEGILKIELIKLTPTNQ